MAPGLGLEDFPTISAYQRDLSGGCDVLMSVGAVTELFRLVGSHEVVTDDRLGELYRVYGADAFRLAFVMTGNREAAEDISQDAFVRVGRKIFGLRDPDHERAYLFRTVINLCRSRGRKLNRERAAIGRLKPQPQVIHPEPDETWGRLLALPPRQRAALFFRYYLDQSETSSAEALDCSTSALKSLVSRGLSALREAEGDKR